MHKTGADDRWNISDLQQNTDAPLRFKDKCDSIVLTMGNETSEILANNGVPSHAVLSVKVLLDVGSDILLHVELFESSERGIDGSHLQLFAHVDIFDDDLCVRPPCRSRSRLRWILWLRCLSYLPSRVLQQLGFLGS